MRRPAVTTPPPPSPIGGRRRQPLSAAPRRRPLRSAPGRASAIAAVLLALLLVGPRGGFLPRPCEARSGKRDRSRPHPHAATLRPHEPGPFGVALTPSDEARLGGGHPVMKQTLPSSSKGDDPDGAGGGAICVQDVMAPPELVWGQILDLNSYKGKVPKVLTSQNYYAGKEGGGSVERIKTRMVLGVLPGYSYESYYDHSYHRDRGSLTWGLDRGRTSDFQDVSGHWRVEPHPTLPSASRVFYACDIKLEGGVPGPILNYISKAALKQATGWVKKESELDAEKKGLSPTAAAAAAETATAAADEAPQPPRKKPRFAFGLGGN